MQLIGAFFYSNVWLHPDNNFNLTAMVPISLYNEGTNAGTCEGAILNKFITNISLSVLLTHFW